MSDPVLEYAIERVRAALAGESGPLGEVPEAYQRASRRVQNIHDRIRLCSSAWDMAAARSRLYALAVVGLLVVGEERASRVTDVECPTCKAKPGQRCRYIRGSDKGGVCKPHPPRRLVAAAKESA